MSKAPRHPVPRKALSLVVALVLGAASVASAAPAVVTSSTTVRSAPFAVAPPVGTLQGGEHVNADETATNGWRRVELPGGKFGFVPDETLKVDLSAPKPAPKPAPQKPAATAAAPAEAPADTFAAVPEPVQPLPARKAAGAHPPIYVSDFSQLALLVKADQQVFEQADGIASRHTASSVAIWGGVFGGFFLAVLAESALRSKTCVGQGSSEICTKETNTLLLSLGSAMIIWGPLIGWAIRPTRDDKTDVINAWNLRHPDTPFIDRAGIEAP